jgi:hypothetical protein
MERRAARSTARRGPRAPRRVGGVGAPGSRLGGIGRGLVRRLGRARLDRCIRLSPADGDRARGRSQVGRARQPADAPHARSEDPSRRRACDGPRVDVPWRCPLARRRRFCDVAPPCRAALDHVRDGLSGSGPGGSPLAERPTCAGVRAPVRCIRSPGDRCHEPAGTTACPPAAWTLEARWGRL